MKAIQIEEFGGPEVLRYVDLPEPTAQPGQLLIDVDACGVNYADTHAVEDSYLSRSKLPMVPGGEVVGRTADGRRVVALTATGGYAEKAVAWEAMATEVPDAVSDEAALALVVQGSRRGTCSGPAPGSSRASRSSSTRRPAAPGPWPSSWPSASARGA
ncbi:alcohol dehydrogenase catalytic domain-containing protein [Streptacidiphilus monticola]